ncbi:hypothetical protein [Cupriavidus taiwanensis]|uniref:hypothetical protein n=1 Tax=Cupriavidus taiwanensis TaxID=164546 RepID=UPI000E107DA6|nr:hypothetical protein [Cupriavidus taiwanensis]SOY48531.1 hypothetical protein CBM2592_A190037 [Cupriavidus taiwanensis]SOY83061.1 hypothetical protein CBM2591_A230039 [Cupriavidus taiwanensis]SOZ56261.1 hypothetical protein CBM2617_A200044 [Cupriavidus taiwanensis]SOZ78831.1 hypothetical protein CBM2618_A180046 [Cupriavidus taiwanensis]SOZ79107.1 hypothetical protein CBM2622_A170044 [Cupriavidus taiwanensis]
MTKPTYLDSLVVKAGKRAGVYLEGEVKGERVLMPLTPEGAMQIAADLTRAANAVLARRAADEASATVH